VEATVYIISQLLGNLTNKSVNHNLALWAKKRNAVCQLSQTFVRLYMNM